MKRACYLLTLFSVALSACRHHPVKSKPPFVLLINQPFISDTSIGYKDSTIHLAAEALLINNTDDTLAYANWWGYESKFFKTDSKNIAVADRAFLRVAPIGPDTVWPHSSREVNVLYFRFKKLPDTTFNFRIGMRLLKWKKSYNTIKPDNKAISQAPILWSDVELVKTDRKHHNYDKTPEEYKKQYEKLVDPLTENDRLNYTLSIDQHKISRIKDTDSNAYYPNVLYGKDSINTRPNKKLFGYATVPLKLSNNSNRSLTYITWLCSWDMMYETNNKDVSLMTRFCLGNYPVTNTIPAHSSSILNIPMRFDKMNKFRSYKFKIGMVLLRDDIIPSGVFNEALPIFKRDSNYIIWSNAVEATMAK